MSFESVLSAESQCYLHLGDCLEFMKTLPDNSIDACIIDPPYGMSQHSQQDLF